ncbi:MAG: hypothetical protein QM708_02595 [Propioniciclava sp.]|uniref:hypothetical protein n=1 Tax=Propioniciclava sp. TaxID=2038686 RepID=UPI0039E51D10
MAVETAAAVQTSDTRERSAADRFMRRLLRVNATDTKAIGDAHKAFRYSLVISGIRCLISYVLIPILVPVLAFAGVLAAPIGIALCVIAVVNGIVSVRRFWISDHRSRWMYTWFMAIVFAILAVALYADIARWVAGA